MLQCRATQCWAYCITMHSNWTFLLQCTLLWWIASSSEARAKESLGSMWKQRQFESVCATPSVSFRQWSAYIRQMLWHSDSNVQLHQELSQTVVIPCHLFIISSVPLPYRHTDYTTEDELWIKSDFSEEVTVQELINTVEVLLCMIHHFGSFWEMEVGAKRCLKKTTTTGLSCIINSLLAYLTVNCITRNKVGCMQSLRKIMWRYKLVW